MLHAFEGVELRHARLFDAAIELADTDLIADGDGAGEDAPDGQAAHVVVVIEIGDKHLQDLFARLRRRRNRLDDLVEERAQVCAFGGEAVLGDAVAGDGVDDWEVHLIFGGIKINEEVEDFADDFFGASVLAVDLVDDDDGRQLLRQRLRQDVARLRQRPFAGVNQQHDAVNHLQDALDFAAEVRVARRVNDVDLDVAVVHRGVLGHDGDAALALQVHRVHHAFDGGLVRAEKSRLFQHRVDQRRLAVVNVSDDRDIAHVRSCLHHVLHFALWRNRHDSRIAERCQARARIVCLQAARLLV